MTIGKTQFGMIGEALRVTFRPSGNVSATNVQNAIEELDTEKQGVVSGLTDIAALTPADSNIIVGDGSKWVAESGATARTSLGAQTLNAALTDISGLSVTDGNFIVANGTNWVAESGATALASIGGQASNAGLTEIAGLAKSDGNIIVGNGSAWVAESGATARTSLGLSIGSDVQAFSARLAGVAGLAVTDGNIIVANGTNWVAESGATARTSLGLTIGTDVQAYQAAQITGTWETGTGTTESVVSPAKVKAAILALAPAGALPRSYLAGLGLTNNSTDANNDIDFAIGECRDDADSEDIELTSALTKRLDANWVVGTNQGGLDTGSKAISTWYYPWAIKRTDTGVVDVLFSLSKTSPTMPASYDKKRRIRGAVLTDSAGNIWKTSYRSGQFLFDVGVTDINTTGLGTSAILYAMTAPPDFDAIINTRLYHATNAGILVTSPYDTDSAPNQTGFSHLSTASGNDSTRAEFTRRVNASSQIRFRSTASSTNIVVNTLGFIDPGDN